MNKEIILAIIVVTSTLTIMPITITKAFAISAEQSGCAHGTSDGRIKNADNWYILQPGKGFAFHTKAFNEAYVRCFCATAHFGSDADQATFDCPTSFEVPNHTDGVVDASQAAANNRNLLDHNLQV